MSRSLIAARGLLVAGLLVALAGCTQTSTPAASTDSCAGMISKVLLTDDSATTVATFSAADVPSIFNIAATPAPTCYYKTTTTPPSTTGVIYTVTHRTLLYIGLSDADAEALIASVRKTASVTPWTTLYDDGAPAAPTTTAPSAAAVPLSYSARWNYNFAGGAQDDKGQFGYYAALPVTQGTATHANLSQAENVVRIETELTQMKK